ncbi:putative RNA helicase armi [Pseudolycoriella hygida]|uniref:RNA helicase armi n=1 Tax=Pseudolycoriella hygida TaxID=35572 RepID=A0A9Q0NHD6_9DIPT|nr:putative RNA helicase armi [Pseudolycoriella hygida]
MFIVSVFYSKLIKIGLDVDDIGIITPYVQQVRTIRSIILKSIVGTDIRLPKIGTVEEFQGQERKVILVSTVRTMEKELCKDKRYSLGFIKCAKRMNVAISRARAALVIFGSPKLLSLDENWKALIEHCQKNKCSTNCDNSHMSDHE